jgi:hypothetical protein
VGNPKYVFTGGGGAVIKNPVGECLLLALSQNCEKRLLASLCLSVRPSSWNNSAPAGRIFIEFGI